ncbi:13475_t:CDS:2 [Gigaspora margarita]|uniref:13475_t:CDS:1 n=1 Tax=Gigaspora margarita TaxID=4874 RepID=A0ABN7UKR7_GIGMA|nr:13475_t:CDS:2 [Gigaspora margarita]
MRITLCKYPDLLNWSLISIITEKWNQIQDLLLKLNANHAQRQAYAQRHASETTEEAEYHRNNQRQAHSRYHKNESNEQTELQKKNQNKANNHAFNTARLKNYNTNAIIPYNIGHINLECPKCKALHWI